MLRVEKMAMRCTDDIMQTIPPCAVVIIRVVEAGK